MNLENKKIGLALGGGAALGMVHIGVIKALEEYGIKPSSLSGTSVGGLISAFYAFGKSSTEMHEIARKLRWLDITDFTISKLGLFSNKKIDALLKKHLKGARFEDADVPFAVVTTDITNGEKVVIKDGLVSEAIMATTCVPGIFVPVEVGDKMLVDGALAENVPTSPLKEMGAEYIMAVDLSTQRNPKKPKNIVEIMLHTFHYAILKKVNYNNVLPDLTISPDLKDYSFAGLNKCDLLVKTGYQETMDCLQKASIASLNIQ